MEKLLFVIVNKITAEFWSNQDGWVDLDSATRFEPLETEQVNLPIDGAWLSQSAARIY